MSEDGRRSGDAEAARRSAGDTGYVPRARSRSNPRVLLQRLREVMATETEPQRRLHQLVRVIASNMVADVCSLYVRRRTGEHELFATVGLNDDAVHITRLAAEEGLVGWVAKHKKPLSTREAPAHPAFSYRPETGEETLQAFLGVPIMRSGAVLGVLTVQNRTPRRYSDDEIEAAQMVATVFAEIVQSGGLLTSEETQEARALMERPREGRGTPVSPGLAIGTAALLEPDPRTHDVFARSVAEEQARLTEAIAELQKSVDEMIERDADKSQVSREVLEVYRLFAYDRGWARRIEEKVLGGLTAESATEQVQAENREQMRQASDTYLRERMHDLDDLSRRLIRKLSGDDGPPALPENAILFAETLGPAELLELDGDKLAGLVLSDGGGTSHAAIVARALGLPFVSGVPQLVEAAQAGDEVVLDGDHGVVLLRPSADVLSEYGDRRRARDLRLASYETLREEPATTRDGVTIDLKMNAGLLIDMPNLERSGASGIGLFRTELPFLIGRTLPTAAEQEELYRQVLDQANGKPVVFRTADIGSDKRASYMVQPHEANPAMGWRGVRVSLDRAGLFRTQLRAMIAAGEGCDLHVMLPMVTTAAEMKQAREAALKELGRREKTGGGTPKTLKVGAMIETPAAAWDVGGIGRHADFVSIGGNDLAQFFFAADRDSARVSSRYDPLTPPFLAFVARTIREGGRAGVPVSYCGEQASDPLMALALIGMGLRSVSVAASSVGPLKQMIRTLTLARFASWLQDAVADDLPNLRDALLQRAEAEGVALPDWR